MVSFVPRNIKRQRSVNDGVTIRDFTGGWNVSDNELNMSSKFFRVLRNMQLGSDGSITIRRGSRLFADAATYIDRILNMHYFNGAIYVFGANGVVVRVSSTGHVTPVWSSDFAKSLPGAPSGWDSGLQIVTSAIFNGALIAVNGVNKPIIVSSTHTSSYLNDPATGSNANTPVCKYVVTHNQYLVMAGDPDAESTLHISNIRTSGVWLGDTAPNDAVDVDLGSRVPDGSSAIRGLGRFRDRLIVMFDQAALPGTLGVYDASSNHTPTFDDAISNVGCISHRTIQDAGELMLFASHASVNSIERALFTGAIRSGAVSQLIDPELVKEIKKVSTVEGLLHGAFAVYDRTNSSYMLFIPDHEDYTTSTKTRGFVFTYDKELKRSDWYEIEHNKWTCGCVSALDTLFLAQDAQVYSIGDEDYADRIGYEETYDDWTAHTDSRGWNPVGDIDHSGVPIRFAWELPWSDSGKRMLVKSSKYLALDTNGTARFTVQTFIDNQYDNPSDTGEAFLDSTLFADNYGWERIDPLLSPALSMAFLGGDRGGFGNDPAGNAYGSGRPSATERLYAWRAKYRLHKLRIDGDSVDPFGVVSVSLVSGVGSIRRNA